MNRPSVVSISSSKKSAHRIQHVPQRPGRFPYLDHLHRHRRKQLARVHRHGERLALAYFARDRLEVARDMAVADRARGDVEGVDERNTPTQQGGQRSREL